MRIIYVLPALLLAMSSCNNSSVKDDVSFAQVDPLSKIFRESNFFPEFNTPVDVAAGEHASFQFVVRSSKTIEDLAITVSEIKNANQSVLPVARIGFVDYVRVGRKTPDRAKDAIPSLSHYYPDPIIEKPSYHVARDVAQPMWLSVNIPHNAEAGEYKGVFEISGKVGGKPFKMEKEIAVVVYPVVLEEPSLWVTNWFTTSPEAMKIFNSGEDVEPYSDMYWSMIEELAQKMKECYQNVVIISPLEHVIFSESEGKYTFDYTQFDKMVSVFENKGVLKMIEGGHIAGRVGDWGSQFAPMVPEMQDGKKVLTQYEMSSDKAQHFYNQFIVSLMNHLRENKWESIYTQHIADEPISSNIKSYIEIANFVKQLAPDVKLIEACHSHDLENTLDIWVPQLNFYHTAYDFYKERQKAGDEVWFYTCLAPQGDYVNRFLEQPLIKTRLIHWLNYRFGATGYLHWGLNYWRGNVYEETTFSNIESGNVLPGGDSWIVYPEKGKLYSSLRLEAMRDGIADFTLLKMLEKKNEALAKELCRQVCYTWTLYDTEGDHFRDIRRRILQELSK